MKQNPFYKLLVLQLVKKFPKFYGTGKFMSMFTRFTWTLMLYIEPHLAILICSLQN